MKKLYPVILLLSCLLCGKMSFGQSNDCGVTSSSGKFQLDCKYSNISLTVDSAYISEDPDAGYTYVWNGDTTAPPTISVTSVGSYSVIVRYFQEFLCMQTVNVVANSTLPPLTVTFPPAAVCSGSSFTLTATGADLYAWGLGMSSAPDTFHTYTPGVSDSVQKDTSLFITGTDTSNSCVNYAILNFRIDPPLHSIHIEGPDFVCSGSSLSLTAIEDKPSQQDSSYKYVQSFQWTQPYSQSGDTFSDTPINTTDAPENRTYTVTGTSTQNVCTSTADYVVLVLPSPATSISASSATVCEGDSITLTVTGADAGYIWDDGSNDPIRIVTPTSSTSYIVEGFGAYDCSTTDTITVVVNPTPSIYISVPTGPVCSGTIDTVSVFGADTYEWLFPRSATGPVLIDTAINNNQLYQTEDRVYTVTGTDTTTGCTNTQYEDLQVYAQVNVAVTISSNEICSGSPVTLTGYNIVEYQWLSPVSSTEQSITDTPINNTSSQISIPYKVIGTYPVTKCTSDTFTYLVAVDPLPVITVQGPTATCSGSPVTLTASGAETYDWEPGELTGSSVSVNPTETTYYTVTGTDTNGCTNIGYDTLVVNPLPGASVNATRSSACQNDTQPEIVFTGSGQPPFTFFYSDNYGNHNIITSADKTSVGIGVPTDQPGTFTYSLNYVVDGNGCVHTIPLQEAVVTIDAAPVITIQGPSSICIESTATLIASGADTYLWEPGSLTDPSISVTPEATTLYTVTGTNTLSGCTGTDTFTLSVNPLPDIAVEGPSVICSGSSATLTASGAETYDWEPGELTGSSVSVNPTETTYYSVMGTDVNGCVNYGFYTLEVDLPLAVVNATSSSACQNDQQQPEVTFTSISGQPPFTFFYNNGQTLTTDAGQYSAVLKVPTDQPGTFTYTLNSVSDKYCRHTMAPQEAVVTIESAPNVSIEASQSTICSGSVVTLTASGADTYQWQSPSSTDATINVTPESTTSYMVTGTNKEGCTDTATSTVVVNPLPDASISNVTNVIVADHLITCQNRVQPEVTFTGSGLPPFTFFYNNGQTLTTGAGQYSAVIEVPTDQPNDFQYVLDSVTDGNGCRKIISDQSVEISVYETPNVSIQASSGIVNCGGSATLTATGAETYEWQQGDFSTDPAILVTPKGTTTYQVIGSNSHGCPDTASYTVFVNSSLAVRVFAFPDTVCSGSSATLIATGADTYQWQTGQLTDTINVTPDITRTYTVTGFDTASGCSGTADYQLAVRLPLSASINTTSSKGCQYDTANHPGIIFTGTVGKLPYTFGYTINAGREMFIKTSPGNNAVEMPVPTGNSGTFIYRLTSIADDNKCVREIENEQDSVTVTIYPSPVLISLKNPASVCSGSPFSYEAESSLPGTSFTWSRDSVTGILNAAKRNIQDSVINETLINTSPGPVTVTYNFTLTAGGNCSGTGSVQVIVNPLPSLTGGITNLPACSDSVFTYKASSTAGTSFSWTRTTPSGIETNAPIDSVSNNITATFKDTTTHPITITYTFVLVNGNCRNVDSVHVTVNPLPSLINTNPVSTICSGLPFIDTVRGSVPGTSFTWSRSSVAGISNAAKINIQDSVINETLINTSPGPVTVTYNFTLTAGGSCSGKDTSLQVIVNPIPSITNTKLSDSICSGSPFVFRDSSSVPETSFAWSRDSVIGITNAAKRNIQGSVINETLIDTLISTTVPVVYTITSTKAGCSDTTTVNVKVKPAPFIRNISDTFFCNQTNVAPITFDKSSPTDDVTWTASGVSIGLTAGTGADVVPGFTTINADTVPRIDTITVEVRGSVGCESTIPRYPFTITVNPIPQVTKILPGASICNGSNANLILHSPSAPSLSWTDINKNIGLTVQSGIDSILPSFVAKNAGYTPVTDSIKIHVYKDMITGCPGPVKDTVLTIIVNPTPTLSNQPVVACSGSLFQETAKSVVPNTTYIWSRAFVTGVKPDSLSKKDSVISETLTLDANVKSALVKYIFDLDTKDTHCKNTDSIVVNVTKSPGPGEVSFTSLLNTSFKDTLTLCNASQNINFNANGESGLIYQWTSVDSLLVDIKSKSSPNTVISFNKPGNFTITATAKYPNFSCPSSVSQTVNVMKDTTIDINLRKIFSKQPGNLLIYPDNSLSKYQWGYDVLAPSDTPNTRVINQYHPVPGQVYQFYTPDPASCGCIKANDSLNTDNFYYWVLLTDAKGCNTRLYYNGPFDDKPDSVRLPAPVTAVQLQVIPNPNSGVFDISIKGNMYGNVEAQVYNSAGRLVFQKRFVKTTPNATEKFIASGLPTGVYFLVLRSSDLKEAHTRFIISH